MESNINFVIFDVRLFGGGGCVDVGVFGFCEGGNVDGEEREHHYAEDCEND